MTALQLVKAERLRGKETGGSPIASPPISLYEQLPPDEGATFVLQNVHLQSRVHCAENAKGCRITGGGSTGAFVSYIPFQVNWKSKNNVVTDLLI